MTHTSGIRDVAASYNELYLVEQPSIALLESLGWTHADLFAETFGPAGTEGRLSEHEVILERRLRAALERLNPELPEAIRREALDQAVEQLTQDRSKQIAVNANREFYRLLKEGVKVFTGRIYKAPAWRVGHRPPVA